MIVGMIAPVLGDVLGGARMPAKVDHFGCYKF